MTPKKSTNSRGYGHRHQVARKDWQPKVEAGGVRCRRCGLEIAPTGLWDLGHDDLDRDAPAAPEHRSCNRKAGGRLRAVRAAGRRQEKPADLAAWRRIARDPKWQDDPATSTHWGPPWGTGTPMIWSQPWFDWRAEVK